MAGKVPIQNFIYESWQCCVTWIQQIYSKINGGSFELLLHKNNSAQSILSWDEIFSDLTMNFLSFTPLNRWLSFSSIPLPLYLALFWQWCRVKVWHIIRSAVVPRPLPPWHVQALCGDLTASEDNTTFHCRAEWVPLWNSPTRFSIAPTISMICKYNQAHLHPLSLAQHRAETCWWMQLHFSTPLSREYFV